MSKNDAFSQSLRTPFQFSSIECLYSLNIGNQNTRFFSSIVSIDDVERSRKHIIFSVKIAKAMNKIY